MIATVVETGFLAHLQSVSFVSLSIFRTVDILVRGTCRLHANTVHCFVAVSSLPFAINVHIDARSLLAWFIYSPST